MNNSNLIAIQAKLRLKTTDEGGRQSGIKTGYRPNHVFEYDGDGKLLSTYIGEISFEKDWIQLGAEEIVTVKFLSGQSIEKYLNTGTKWWIHEGLKVVGEAEILRV
ncbi:MAG: hypothetical protein ACMVP2_01270 [Imperialibacter sp.]|uniref:hypothetical protein n=1 Tax=Imperialibacter sp. TaxID=2038411 RepID=UPI003A8834B5